MQLSTGPLQSSVRSECTLGCTFSPCGAISLLFQRSTIGSSKPINGHSRWRSECRFLAETGRLPQVHVPLAGLQRRYSVIDPQRSFDAKAADGRRKPEIGRSRCGTGKRRVKKHVGRELPVAPRRSGH